MPVDLWVEEQSGEAVYFQRTANVSEGGLFVETAVPQPVGTRLGLRFQLPDEAEQVNAQAEIIKVDTDEEPTGVHLRFIELAPHAAEQIARFVERRRG